MPTGTPKKLKHCAICGNLFLPTSPSNMICPKPHYTHCPICGKSILWNTTRPIKPCCKECRKEAARKYSIEKYGCNHPMQNTDVRKRYKQTMLKKYGVQSPLQSTKIRQKAIESNRDKFNADWALSNPKFRQNIQTTMQKKYGGKTTLESPTLKQRVQNTILMRYGVQNISQIKSRNSAQDINNESLQNALRNFIDMNQSLLITMKSTIQKLQQCRYGITDTIVSPEIIEKLKQVCLEKYGTPYGCLYSDINVPKKSIEFHDLLASKGIQSTYEFFIEGEFYDLFVPEYKTLIKFDSTYTNNLCISCKTNEAQLAKIQKLNQQYGLRCLHIFDWDDWNKIANLLLPKIQIPAHKCKMYLLKKNIATKFLDSYHLYNSSKNQILSVGLVYNDELYQVMTFGKSIVNKNFSVELSRFCTKPGYQILGGASKLFHWVVTNYELTDVISFCDVSKFSGEVYLKMGMELLTTSDPKIFWSKAHKKFAANSLQQKQYIQSLQQNPTGISEELLLLRNNWLPILDYGQNEYYWKAPKVFKI